MSPPFSLSTNTDGSLDVRSQRFANLCDSLQRQSIKLLVQASAHELILAQAANGFMVTIDC